MTKRNWGIAGLFIFGVFVFAFQNCRPSNSPVSFTDPMAGKAHDNTEGTGGQGYDGKIYVLLGELCSDGTQIQSQIVLTNAGGGQLTRQNCQDIVPAIPLTAGQIQLDATDSSRLTYNGQTYIETLPLNVSALPQALKMADFILSLQEAGGAIKESPGATLCNQDSNMEYALLGLAAAYVRTKDLKYLTGFEKGIAWLADRQDMSATEWKGSWFNSYSCSSPYAHVATSPGAGVTDVRGVDTTSAYFAYLVYIHSRITQSNDFVVKYADNAKAALEFLIRKNLTAEGLSSNSYQLVGGTWTLYPYQYTSGQADVLLGFRAGSLLYDGADRRYGLIADGLKQKIPILFFDSGAGRFAEGREGSALDWANEFEAIFPQGYVAWVLGANTETQSSYQWLAGKVQSNGSLLCYSNDPVFTISAAEYLMAANALGQPSSVSTGNWILSAVYDSQTGGLKDSMKDNTQYANVAAFAILALLKQGSLDW